MRIGIVRIGREKDADSFAKQLAELVEAGYQVGAGTGDIAIVRVGDVIGADAAETAKAVMTAARAKLAGKPVVITGLDAADRVSLAALFEGDGSMRIVGSDAVSAVMSLDLGRKLSGAASADATEEDMGRCIAKVLEGRAAGETMSISVIQRVCGCSFPRAAKVFDLMSVRDLIERTGSGRYVVSARGAAAYEVCADAADVRDADADDVCEKDADAAETAVAPESEE